MAVIIRTVVIAFCLSSVSAFAVVETYQFSSPEKELRYQAIIDDLRCPKCQNQNLSGSNSPIAQDLRQQVYNFVEQERSKTAIEAFMVERYGDFVLYEPPFKPATYILWLLPIVLLVIALLLVIWIKSQTHAQDNVLLDEKEQQRLAALLKKYQG